MDFGWSLSSALLPYKFPFPSFNIASVKVSVSLVSSTALFVNLHIDFDFNPDKSSAYSLFVVMDSKSSFVHLMSHCCWWICYMQLVTLVALIVSDQQNQHCNQKNWRVGSGVKGGGEEVSTMITARNKLINNLLWWLEVILQCFRKVSNLMIYVAP